MAEEEKMPIITTSSTSGLASVQQLTDDTPNEIFTVRHSTSGTETILIVENSESEEEQEAEKEEA
ncbi:MAG: hypothetical protein ACFFFC_15655 [Candidatus Thorarchaeota archaeon]